MLIRQKLLKHGYKDIVTDIIFFIVMKYISFGVMEAFDSKGIINTLEKYYVSQLECVDLATFPFAT